MADLIDRQAVLSLPRLTHKTLSGEIVAEYISVADIEALPEEPSAEPEAIRCKDCKYKYVDGDNVKFNLCALNHNKVQSDDWYCADAEREENETD